MPKYATALSVWETQFLFNVLDDPEWYSAGSFWNEADNQREASLRAKLARAVTAGKQ